MNTFARILLSSFGLCIAVGLIWGVVQFTATMSLKSDMNAIESVGLTGLVMSFIAAAVAFVNGIVLGAITPGEHLLKRLLWHVVVYLVLAMAWSVYSIRSETRHDLKSLVSTRNYAAFEKQISGHLNEAWGAALIHADPEAMRLCIKQGANAQTWARVDTSLVASQPNESPIELIVLHRYWSSHVDDQQRMAKDSLRLLSEHGADLNARCIENGTMTPLEYATGKNLPVLIQALNELGATR